MDFEKDFKNWYERVERTGLRKTIQWFNTLEFSMKLGVYEEFFDEKEIRIEVFPTYQQDSNSWAFEFQINESESSGFYQKFNTRQEARKAALTKAIEIYNGSK